MNACVVMAAGTDYLRFMHNIKEQDIYLLGMLFLSYVFVYIVRVIS